MYFVASPVPLAEGRDTTPDLVPEDSASGDKQPRHLPKFMRSKGIESGPEDANGSKDDPKRIASEGKKPARVVKTRETSHEGIIS